RSASPLTPGENTKEGAASTPPLRKSLRPRGRHYQYQMERRAGRSLRFAPMCHGANICGTPQKPFSSALPACGNFSISYKKFSQNLCNKRDSHIDKKP
ncbi:MAG: hypothetical protein ACI4IW_01145, partial [Oscillospiraceae bacterium]